MSSIASSPLTLELKPAWVLLAALSAWLMLLAVSIWQSALPLPIGLVLAAVTLAVGAFMLSRQLFSFTSRALRRVTLHPEGEWTLADGRGGQWEATLLPPIRFMRSAAFLRWKSHRGRHWALVTARSCGEAPFRHLRLRLRFS